MAKTQNKAAGAKTAGKNKKFKKRERKNVPFGLVFIQASFNNTIVTITDQAGNTLSRLRPRVRDPRTRNHRHRGAQHPRRYADAAQRMPSAQAP
jgi:hypothetical protein